MFSFLNNSLKTEILKIGISILKLEILVPGLWNCMINPGLIKRIL